MTHFFLIRHGATDMLGTTLAGRMPGVHLNRNGRMQAEAVARRLGAVPLSALYSSPQERAQETARPLAERQGLPTVICAEADEIDFGAWTGAAFDQLARDPEWRRFNTFRSGTRIPGGESMAEVQARITGALEQLRRHHSGGSIALVSHGDVIKAALAYYGGIPLDFIFRFEISPGSVSSVGLGEAGPRLLCVNHLGELRFEEHTV